MLSWRCSFGIAPIDASNPLWHASADNQKGSLIMGFGSAMWQELASGFPDSQEMAHITVRLLIALVLGGLLGFQRARVGKAAGMRTHMLVTLGATIVVLLPHLIGMTSADLSRVVQGTITGIGFIGGGVILKMSEQHQILGVTTASSIWLAATLGIVTGTGRWGLAVTGAVLAFIILAIFGWIESKLVPSHVEREA
jgi:putative Mg2+ transporter-C (MgtC) family protein